MNQLLIATTNPGKIMTIKKILARIGYEGLSFADLDIKLTEPPETKLTAEKIATEKALGYAKQFKNLPILARDDTCNLIGVKAEDDPKNHNKVFVTQKMGEYTDQNGEKVFSDIAKKYGGSIPLQFEWGYALAWHEHNKINVVSTLTKTDIEKIKLVDQISPQKVPGFCFSSIMQVKIGEKWIFDSELSEEENWEAYWNTQQTAIETLINQCPLLNLK